MQTPVTAVFFWDVYTSIDQALVHLIIDDVEGVRICETDRNGVEHCRSLSEGRNGVSKRNHSFDICLFILYTCYTAQAMQEEGECFCARDSQGHKVCEPANCDAGRDVPPVAGDN